MTERDSRSGVCLDPATIAEYIDGRRDAAVSRSEVEAHLAGCEDCYELFAEATRLTFALSPSADEDPDSGFRRVGFPRRVSRRAVASAAGALATAAALWLIVAPPAVVERWWDPASRPELREVVAAVGPRRAVEARLTGRFSWASPPSATRGAIPTGDLPDVQMAVARLTQRARAERTPIMLSALGTAYLASGQIQRAVETLEETVALADDVAFAWSDLAAAYLARSTFPGNAADVPRALEAAERALALQPDQPEARFNRALAIERLGLVEPALDAWRHYLTLDADSPWAAEARAHVAALEQRQAQAGGDDLQRLRERLFDEMLPGWTAIRPSDTRATPGEPDTIIDIAGQLSRRSSDRFAADVVAAATRPADPARAASGHAAYGRARAHYRGDAMDAAGPAFDQAATDLLAAGNPLALSARFYRALVVYRASDLASAEQRLAALLPEVPPTYPSLAGRVKWTLGLVATRRGDFVEAARLYRSSLHDFEEAGEAGNAAFMRLLLAENEERRGEPLRAWQHRLAAFEGAPREGTLLQSAQSALRLNWPFTAAMLQDEAARIARSQQRMTTLVDALRLRAVTYASIDHTAAARRLVGDARALMAHEQDSIWTRLRAEVDLAEAQATTAAEAEAGIEAATRAAQYFSSTGGTGRLPEVLLVRGRLRRLGHDIEAARADVIRSLQLLEAQRDRLPAGLERLAFGEIAKRAADELVEIEIAAGSSDAAIAAADRVRGWDLTAGSDAPAGMDLERIRRELDESTTILYYSVGQARTYLWTLRTSGTVFHVVPASKDQLRRLVASVREDRLESEAMRKLHDLLVAPAAGAIAQSSRTIVVADGPLHALPFAALPGVRSRFLAEEQALLFVPALAALAPVAHRPGGGPPRSVLAVGNPRLDPQVFPGLQNLPAAAEEAHRVARLYDAHRILVETEATSEALLAALTGFDVLHFAGHAIVNDVNPEHSQLGVLNRDNRPLTAADISRLALPHMSLAVLGACRSLGPVTDRGQGPMSLARAFLQAGVRRVVANRWLVDDRAAVTFLESFHDAYRSTGDAVVSLQRAQRALLASGEAWLRDPSAWAGWVIIGGDDKTGTRLSTRAHSVKEKP